MFDIKGLRTFAMSAKNLDKSVEFYTRTLGGQIVKTVDPTEEQKKAGQVKEVDVRLGNFEVHLFDASIKPREVDPRGSPVPDHVEGLRGLPQGPEDGAGIHLPCRAV